ncbi:MAG: glycoside hydrolase family 16 protein [Solirubrobacterales bacterium]
MARRAARTLLAACVATACLWAAAHALLQRGTSDASVAEARGVGHPIWSDEFNGRAGSGPNRTKWRYDVGGHGWGNHELERYTRRLKNARLDGRGHLVITARDERRRGHHRRRYTSARLKTFGHFSFRYGRIAARMRVPRGRGLWPALWMMGANIHRVGYPRCGEIDVMELLGQHPRTVYGTVHGPGPRSKRGIGGKLTSRRSLSRGFHLYAASWGPHRIRFSVDGRAYKTVWRSRYPKRDTWAFRHRMFLILNLAVGGRWPGPPSSRTRFPAQLKVDWVRVWHQTASGAR